MGSCVRESVREREVLSYDPALLSNFVYNDQAVPIPNSQLRSSIDPVLTSLAQLGACRTGIAHSFVSLFDKKWQYIVAEATPNLSLLPNLADADREGETLWLCQTAVPRDHGVCNWALLHDEPAGSTGQDLPVTIAEDLQTDPRFSTKKCVVGSPARFYVAAPIRSSRGINIGVYSLIHDEPISEQDAKARGWDVIVRQVTRTIMTHLESRRAAVAFERSENMMVGVASYLSNQTTTLVGSQAENHPTSGEVPRTPTSADGEGKDFSTDLSASPRQLDDNEVSNQPDVDRRVSSSDMRDDKEHGSGESVTVDSPSISSRTAASAPAPRPGLPPRTISKKASTLSKKLWPSDSDDLSLESIFTRAATVIRTCLEIGDVSFFNASSGSFGSLLEPSRGHHQSPDSVTTSSSSDEMSLDSRVHDSGFCHVLGTSRSTGSDKKAAPPAGPPAILPASLIASLLKRHPRGRIFNFDEHGALQTSESSEDGTPSLRIAIPTPKAHANQHTNPTKTRWSSQRQGEVLLEMFPGARSICFAPIWDSKKERWYAAGLACTYEHNRIFIPRVELSYLRAFGTLLMSDVYRLEATRSHQAQSDILGSISHELRSPLHGLILSTELLADTHIDTFQGNLLHTIETCGRTLLDTVDHLLDYSKVNHFMNSNRKRKTRVAYGRRLSIEDGMKIQVSDVRLDTLVEEVVESVFAGFRRMSTEYSLHHDRRKTTDPDIGATMASKCGAESKSHSLNRMAESGWQKPSIPANVAIYVDIEPGPSYKCRTVAGAIRRVVMNLVGNSLKYTDKGRIDVRLSRDDIATKRRGGIKQNMIRIVVSDTGKGMSKDFLDNDLFKPFMQEDQLSAGTGVGLSLVKKLVSSLGGEVSVKSQLDVGTAVTVLLPLPPVDLEIGDSKEDEVFGTQQHMLKGLRVRLTGYNHTTDDSPANARGNVPAVESICKGWLGMEVVSEPSDLVPDVMLCVESSLHVSLGREASESKPPIVVVCPNVTVAHRRTLDSMLHDDGQVYEFISQPTGPRKLARVLLLAFNRWLELQDVKISMNSRRQSVSIHTPSTETGSQLTPATIDGVGWSDPPSTESATQFDSYFPMIASPRNPYESPDTEPSPPEEPSDPPTQATPSPIPPLALPPVVPSPRHSSRPRTPLPRSQFLLVDDNPINLRILCAYMKKLDRAYTTAVDGMEAVEVFKANPGRFTCILMDINMPRLDGLKATQQIRAYERDTKTPNACAIFALTGLASAETQREAFESGIGLFLTKPVKLKELSEILRSRGLI
ncbi:uncharacterized protein PG998_012264 [Apiospora kogelbergensis]|uniref:uncharacterized protein n=1 Tax=Apiospora kogelbergensis TaxID=1337665 RepID=UPI003130B456